MDKVLQKLKKVLKEEFPSAKLEIKRDWYPARIGGSIIWRGFNGKDDVERVHRVWRAIRRSMTEAEQKELGFFFTFNPVEHKVHLRELALSEKIG
jgi:hypothetical protein